MMQLNPKKKIYIETGSANNSVEQLTKGLWFMLDSIDITEQVIGKH